MNPVNTRDQYELESLIAIFATTRWTARAEVERQVGRQIQFLLTARVHGWTFARKVVAYVRMRTPKPVSMRCHRPSWLLRLAHSVEMHHQDNPTLLLYVKIFSRQVLWNELGAGPSYPTLSSYQRKMANYVLLSITLI